MKTINIFFIFAALAMLVSCKNDEPAGPAVDATFTLTSEPAAAPAAPPAEAGENISTWWVAFVNQESREVVKIVSRAEGVTGEVTEDHFKVNLEAGKYTAYAFANITPEELKAATGLIFIEGDTMKGDPKTAVFKDYDPNETGRIPMSGYLEVNVSDDGTVSPKREIEVVRMYAKVELVFTNESSSAMTVESYEFAPLYLPKAPVLLMPDYLTLGGKPNPFTEGEIDLRGNAPKRLLTVGESLTDAFYTREIISQHPSGSFVLTVNTTADGVKSTRHSLAYELSYINRNDWVRIPVTLTDWIVDMDVRFYPPIGGYPAVVVDQKNEEFYATFGTPGKFVLTPRARKSVQASYEQVEVTEIKTEGDAIFTTGGEPAIDKVTGEIIGTMSEAKGTAVTTIKFRVEADKNVSHVFTRKFHIIRK